MKSLKIALLVIFPLISSAQWSIIGGLTLNQSRFIDYNYPEGDGSNPIPTFVIKKFRSKTSPNFLVGIRRSQLLTKKIGFSGEVLFINRSMKYENDTFYSNTLRQLSVPIELNYSISKVLKVTLGPQLDYSLKKNIGLYKRINYSANAGVSFNVSKNLELGLRLNKSIFSMINSDYDHLFKNDFMTSQINLSYQLKNN